MYRLNITVLTLWLALAPAFAQMNSFFPGPGTPASSGGGYTGPGDVVSGASAWWGLRCYNAAYAGNVADLTDSSTGTTTGTRLVCNAGVVSALVSGSACTFVTGNACSSLATTCATACNVEELYDQTGNANHLIQAGNSARPTYTQNCLNTTLPCTTWTTASNLATAGAVTAIPVPFTISQVYNRTTAQFTDYLTDGNNTGIIAGATASAIQLYNSGGSAGVTAADAVWNAIQGLQNGASSTIKVNNVAPAAAVPGASTSFGTGGASFGANTYAGKMTEVGIWPIGFSTTQQTNMCHNQFTYWATSASC